VLREYAGFEVSEFEYRRDAMDELAECMYEVGRCRLTLYS